MTIEKLKSGSYRIRRQKGGKLYLVTVDHKPTKAEAEELILAEIQKTARPDSALTFGQQGADYIQSRSAVLSPTTIINYENQLKKLPDWLRLRPTRDVSQADIQRAINQEAAVHAAKTVRNYSGFLSAVMRSYDPNWISSARLPQKKATDFYVPEEEDVRRILDYAKGSRYEVALWLACFGLRRSEIAALTAADLVGNQLTINKAKVPAGGKKWAIKAPKTADSVRTITIPDFLADLIREKGVYDGHQYSIGAYLGEVQRILGISHFSLHKLRHYFAATARTMMSDSYVEKMGGWRPGSDVMKKVYAYAEKKKAEEAKQEFADKLTVMFRCANNIEVPTN